jgi:hypothetical protein
MSMHTGRLVLTLSDPHLVPDAESLRARLTEQGFIGAPLRDETTAFLAGDRFLALMTFAGCSVQIELTPPAHGGPFCHVRFAGPFARPRLLHGRNTRPPRCRACRAPLKDWLDFLSPTGEAAPPRLPCPACGEEHPPWEWDWKEGAGYGRFFIQVEEVFPGEAVPAPELLRILQKAEGGNWRYFYTQDP